VIGLKLLSDIMTSIYACFVMPTLFCML